MAERKKDEIASLPTTSVGPSESCTLELSADGKWMRLIVGGRLLSAFNVEYVRKVLGDASKETKKRPSRGPEVPANI